MGVMKWLLFSTMIVSFQLNSEELTSTITTHLGDNKTFRGGDQFSLIINQSQTAYAMIIYENANSELVQIFPNQLENKMQLEQGRYYPLKLRQETLWFTVSPPFGKEKLWLFSSPIRFPELEQYKENIGIYFTFNISMNQLKKHLQQYFHANNSYLKISNTHLTTQR